MTTGTGNRLPLYRRKAFHGVIIVFAFVATVGLWFAGAPAYPGSDLVFFGFLSSAIAFLYASLVLWPSFYIVAVGAFLTLGFLVKSIAHFDFGTPFIEPVGNFSSSASQWDTALLYAASGLFGGTAAVCVAALIPSMKATPRQLPASPRLSRAMLAALVLLLIAAFAIYGFNYRYTILRIGYPLGLDIDPRIYLVLTFIITWGALIGGLTITQWLIELDRLSQDALIYVAAVLGFLASFTMGSRIQFLLYLFAAALVVMWQWRSVRSWWRVAAAVGVSGVLFAVSLVVVSIERNVAFLGSPPPSEASVSNGTPDAEAASKAGPIISKPPTPSRQPLDAGIRDKLEAPSSKSQTNQGSKRIVPTPDFQGKDVAEAKKPNSIDASDTKDDTAAINAMTGSTVSKIEIVTQPGRLSVLLKELRSLIVMRWVGLEGVMTTAGAQRELGYTLLSEALAEDPAAGAKGMYQHMAGDYYGNVRGFTFLTLPGVIGVASFSSHLLFIGGFVFAVLLAGHFIEWLALKLTHNVATGASAGVALAYLTVQMGFPWTIIVFAVELLLSLIALAGLRAGILYLSPAKPTEV